MELLRFTKLMMGDDEAMVFRILFLGGEEGGSFIPSQYSSLHSN